MHFALSSDAVLWGGVFAHLCKEQTFVNAAAAIQACCGPVLQSSTQQWGMPCAEVTAHLCAKRIFMSAVASSQACCQQSILP